MATRTKVGIGCGVVAVVAIVALIVGVVSIVRKAKDVIAYAATSDLERLIDDSGLSAHEKADAKATLQRFLDQVKAGKVPMDTASALVEELRDANNGMAFAYIMLRHFEAKIEGSNLPAADKKMSAQSVSKLYAAMRENRVTQPEMYTILNAMPKGPDRKKLKTGAWEDEEIKAVITVTDAVLADKKVTVTGARYDPADEIRTLVKSAKEAMAEKRKT